jgi:hypothetical protein
VIPGSLDPGEDIGLLEPLKIASAWLRRGPRCLAAAWASRAAAPAPDTAARRGPAGGGNDEAGRLADVAAAGLKSREY